MSTTTRQQLVTPWMFYYGGPFVEGWYKQPFFLAMFALLGLPPTLLVLYHAMKVGIYYKKTSIHVTFDHNSYTSNSEPNSSILK